MSQLVLLVMRLNCILFPLPHLFVVLVQTHFQTVTCVLRRCQLLVLSVAAPVSLLVLQVLGQHYFEFFIKYAVLVLGDCVAVPDAKSCRWAQHCLSLSRWIILQGPFPLLLSIDVGGLASLLHNHIRECIALIRCNSRCGRLQIQIRHCLVHDQHLPRHILRLLIWHWHDLRLFLYARQRLRLRFS